MPGGNRLRGGCPPATKTAVFYSLPAFAAALCDSGLSRQELAELRRLLERDEL